MNKLVKLGVVSMASLLLVACGGDTTSEDVNTTEEATEVTEVEAEGTEEVSQDKGVLNVGDATTIDGVTFTVTGVEYVDERNEFADVEADKVLKVSYKIDNNTEEDYPFGMDGSLYVDGALAETYPNENSMGSVSSGRSVEGVQHYAISGEPSELELEWEPLMSFSGDKGIWNVNPQ